MKVIDISWPISSATTGYKDKKIFEVDEIKKFARDNVRETAVRLSTHTGTHVDAPSHFLLDGKTIDEMKLDHFVGPCQVLDLTAVEEHITREDLESFSINAHEIILLKTTNSNQSPTGKFSPHFVYLAESGAFYLKEKKVKAVGIDYLGIEHSQQNHMTHISLMEANIAVIEGLRLQPVASGNYFFVCLPLYLIGLEAAPARAVLIAKF